MSDSQALAVREKQELAKQEEKTVPGRYYVPATDIFETDAALMLALEMPGVERENVNVKLESGTLTIEGEINFAKYEDLYPVYTEYNVGNYARSFQLSSDIDQDRISAERRINEPGSPRNTAGRHLRTATVLIGV